MCDTTVVVGGRGGAVWFAKNSDREAGESQVVEHVPAAKGKGESLRVTWVSIPEVAPSFEMVLSRPTWMWGAEMGVNEHGLAIGNEAVFTRLPVADEGLTGMDLLRLALERTRDADSALDFITGMLAKYGQGGRCGFRSKGFRYHNAFVIADRKGAWLLETADRFWAAVRVASGVRTSSNVLTIGAANEQPDRIADGTLDEAWRRGWWNGTKPFSFRDAFAQRALVSLSGGDVRRECTRRTLAGEDDGRDADLARHTRALRDHNDRDPQSGWRMESPCAHAGFLPTKTAGQTTGSMVAALEDGRIRVWATGTSAPCVSVFKPVRLGAGTFSTGPVPSPEGADRESLWWRHERLHRAVMQRGFGAFEATKALFEAERAELEREAWEASDDASASELWERHRALAVAWAERVEHASITPATGGLSARARRWFWEREAKRDGL
ncbi:MAG: C69 family dipeptidase [Myxococcales bacterium]|nr:C69 family dipeptidase [Myxococcales bacterium]